MATRPGKRAVVTMGFNDWNKLEAWASHTCGYIRAVDLHVVVSLAPQPEFRMQLQQKFPGSMILELPDNVGPIVGYNHGIRYALEHGAEYIALIGNDGRILEHDVDLLFNCLVENPDVGHVAPVLLRRGTEGEVEWAGALIGKWGMSHITLGIGQDVHSIPPGLSDIDFIPGGCNFGSAQMFRKVGLQDERLFMYGDEMDFDTRVKRAGYRVAVLGEAHAWHEHIDPEYQKTVSRSDRRSSIVLYLAKLGNINSEREIPPWIIYLVNRNRVLIARWHKSWPRFLVFALLTLIKMPLAAVILWLVYSPKHAWAFLMGKCDGFRGVSGKPTHLMDSM